MNEVPSTPEELADFKRDFHVVIFGDFAPTDLGEARERFLKELENWVQSEFFGGGFIMIAGPNSSPIAWVGTDIEKMLPIEIEENPPPEPRGYDRVYQPRLTPLGWNHPITRLDPDLEENRRKFFQLTSRTFLNPPEPPNLRKTKILETEFVRKTKKTYL